MILVVNLPRRQYYSKCVLVDIHIYYHFRKDERPGDGQTCLFYLILLGLVFVSRRVVFMPAKPMWKLYLVWAILSSVPLLYVFSNRCHVMSTINTHKHKHKRTRATCWLPPRQFFVFVVAIFFFTTQHEQVEMKKSKKTCLVSLPVPVWKAGRCVWILTGSEEQLFSSVLTPASHCHQELQSPPGFYLRVGVLRRRWSGVER